MVVPFLHIDVVCHFSLQALRIFLCQIPFVCTDCIFWLRVLKFPVHFHFFANSLMSSMTFSCDLLRLYPVVDFLSMWFSDIIGIMNIKSDSTSPLKYLFGSLLQLSSFHPPGFSGFLEKVYDFMWYFVHLDAVYYSALRTHIISV